MKAEDVDPGKTDWDKVRAMKDADIDTSDIPPLSDAFYKNAQDVDPGLQMAKHSNGGGLKSLKHIRPKQLHDKVKKSIQAMVREVPRLKRVGIPKGPPEAQGASGILLWDGTVLGWCIDWIEEAADLADRVLEEFERRDPE